MNQFINADDQYGLSSGAIAGDLVFAAAMTLIRGTIQRDAEAVTSAEEFARAIARETGNALCTQARGEVRLSIDTLYYFAGLAGELKGITIPLG
ncbi:hypothetical protein [Phytoactinopolyspora limicola]|uniref:hypothetical protein n=1 Tax=Phytoactinopolyspora limicola TaxID=2715536 RepID=UPI001408F637|nr:hypothetical protein [Phytoactinopolyspora limicola]